MQTKESQTFIGERAEFNSRETLYRHCLFTDGESPIKEAKTIEASECTFAYKYPLWYGSNLKANKCLLAESERAGIWYSEDVRFADCEINGVKNFRKCRGLVLGRCSFSNALETLWWCEDVKLSDIKVQSGNYFGMGCKKVKANNLTLQGDYAFDGAEEVEISDSTLLTKDAFWNCKKIRLMNCEITGEYFGWNSDEVTLINCRVHSHQGFCYMKKLTLIDCYLEGTDLAFEYCSDIDAEIQDEVISVKNPISGKIKAKKIDQIIRDDDSLDRSLTEIIPQ
jgi:hypothetical protein